MDKNIPTGKIILKKFVKLILHFFSSFFYFVSVQYFYFLLPISCISLFIYTLVFLKCVNITGIEDSKGCLTNIYHTFQK